MVFEPDANQPADLLGALRTCIERGARALLLDRGAIPAAFFDLSTGNAGEVAQKLVDYRIRMAAVVPDLGAHSARFREFASEAQTGRWLRFFATREQAVDWLTSALP